MRKLLSVWLLAIVAMFVAAPQVAASSTSLLAEILDDFNTRHPGQQIGLQAAFTTVESYGGEPLLLLSSMDNSAIEVYDFNASAPGRIKRMPVSQEAVKDVYFSLFPYVYSDLMDVDDNTMRYNPLPVDLNLEKNRFHVVPYGDVAPYADNPRSYDRMIFKPHVNAVSHVPSPTSSKPLFRLDDPAKVKTMFRGYSNPEAVALVVPHEFLNTHTVLQFSRWKSPESIKKLDAYATSAVNDYYRGWRIADSRWLATCPNAERSFYAVTFEPRGDRALAAVVCIAEGSVASAIDILGYTEDGKCIWYGDDNYFEHQPEIMAMMATPEGFEMFVRYYSMEATHYVILREVLDQWVILCDYNQYWFDEDAE